MLYEQYQKYLIALHDTLKMRKLPEILSVQNQCLDFSTNDYLGLSRNCALLDSSIQAGKKYGVGSTGSRLLSGNNELFTEFETTIATDKNTEAALIFNSGFQANISVLSSLLDIKILKIKPLVFFDRLNHASLYQAIFLSDVDLIRYKHNDMNHLSNLLAEHATDHRPKFIISETIFGMDGDIISIENIVSLAKYYKAFLYLDEAHATGVIGRNGYGLSTTVDLGDIPHLIMGTFSKALGCSGGYIACDQIIKSYLINRASGFIYSTANSPLVIGAARKAWEMIKDFQLQRSHLSNLSSALRNTLLALGFNIGGSSSHIIPIIFGAEKLALAAKSILLNNNIIVSCIVPPTVPLGSSRIRIALNVSHTQDDITQLIGALHEVQRKIKHA